MQPAPRAISEADIAKAKAMLASPEITVHDVAETKQAIEVWRASMAGTEKGLAS